VGTFGTAYFSGAVAGTTIGVGSDITWTGSTPFPSTTADVVVAGTTITLNTAGDYLVNFGISVVAVPNMQPVQFALTISGVAQPSPNRIEPAAPAGTPTPLMISMSVFIRVTAGDTLTLRNIGTAGATLNDVNAGRYLYYPGPAAYVTVVKIN
jgi:hypothetical protein